MASLRSLETLSPKTLILVGGNQVLEVTQDIADRFQPGDALRVVEETGELLLIPAKARAVATAAVDRALEAFRQMGRVSDDEISSFFELFAQRLEDDEIWRQIQQVNDEDVADAKRRGRSTTRLVAGDKLRRGVIEGLRGWASATSKRGKVLESVAHDGWVAELVGAELGVVGFVFEGRPNVVADATGVLRGGNTVVFRIGRDALRTAKAIVDLALAPALSSAGLPQGAVSLVESAEHAAGWALFSDRRLSLAVARGSGPAVATLGSLAQQAGIPKSLHGTGGAWIVAAASADPNRVEQCVFDSLDRKVCNTLNTLCLHGPHASEQVQAALRGLQRAAERRGHAFKLHVETASRPFVPAELFERRVAIRRAEGDVTETQAQTIAETELGREWEWEESPEVSLVVTETVERAVSLFNRYSPHFVASLLSSDATEQERFYREIDAPFVGDGYTRWVDGQVALHKPELGLSNWQQGRLFGRGGILSGDSVFTVRTRVRTSGSQTERKG